MVAGLFDLVGAGPFGVEPWMCWPASALISFSSVSPAFMIPSSRSAVAMRDLTIQSVPACYSIKRAMGVCSMKRSWLRCRETSSSVVDKSEYQQQQDIVLHDISEHKM